MNFDQASKLSEIEQSTPAHTRVHWSKKQINRTRTNYQSNLTRVYTITFFRQTVTTKCIGQAEMAILKVMMIIDVLRQLLCT